MEGYEILATRAAEIALSQSFSILLAAGFLCNASMLLILKKRHAAAKASISFALSILVLSVLPNVSGYKVHSYIAVLGEDSLFEAMDFDWVEAIFFVKTLIPSIIRFGIQECYGLLFASCICACFVGVVKGIAAKKRRIVNSFYVANIVCLGLVLALFITEYATFVYNAYRTAGKPTARINAFALRSQDVYSTISNRDLTVVTYIGESTAALHMSVYGYPFNTTPLLESLSKNAGTIKFNRVYSPHTHTTSSLLNAMSLCQKCSATNDRTFANRTSIVDILESAGIETTLWSNQGQRGSSNATAGAIFGRATSIDFAQGISPLAGNSARPTEYDHEYFLRKIRSSPLLFKTSEPRVLLLHSYAGHGPYTKYIPKAFRTFRYSTELTGQALLGSAIGLLSNVASYDSAISYIDYSVAEIMKVTFSIAKEDERPAIFIYFSDHGESPMTGRGHDSSRVNYEMVHIPFFVFFNDAAIVKYEKQFAYLQSLRDLAMSSHIFSEILIYLFGLDVQFDSAGEVTHSHTNELPLYVPDSIVQRKLIDGAVVGVKTFWGLSENNDITVVGWTSVDSSLRTWQAKAVVGHLQSQEPEFHRTHVCQHRANSLAMQLRASISTGCFETDIVFDDGKANVYHPPAKPTGLTLEHFFNSNYGPTNIWIDAKNANTLSGCLKAETWLQSYAQETSGWLLEVPSKSDIGNKDWQDCVSRIDKFENVQVAYYVPTDLLRKCTLALRTEADSADACRKLYSRTSRVIEETQISSITFDYGATDNGYAIERDVKMKDLSWNIWHVEDMAQVLDAIEGHNVGYVLLKNSVGAQANMN